MWLDVVHVYFLNDFYLSQAHVTCKLCSVKNEI